jgi:hypothetical protein
MHFVYGLTTGLFVGGFLSYLFADKLVAKAIAEYQKAVALEERVRRAL